MAYTSVTYADISSGTEVRRTEPHDPSVEGSLQKRRCSERASADLSPPHEDPRPEGRTLECGGTPACSRESPPIEAAEVKK